MDFYIVVLVPKPRRRLVAHLKRPRWRYTTVRAVGARADPSLLVGFDVGVFSLPPPSGRIKPKPLCR